MIIDLEEHSDEYSTSNESFKSIESNIQSNKTSNQSNKSNQSFLPSRYSLFKPDPITNYELNTIERYQSIREKNETKIEFCKIDEKKENKYNLLNEEKKDLDYYYYQDYRAPLKLIEPIKFGSLINDTRNYDWENIKTTNYKSNETIRNEQILKQKNFFNFTLATQNLNQNLYIANSKPLLNRRKFDSFTPSTTYNS